MTLIDRVRELIEPIVAAESAELYDIDYAGGILRILVDHEGGIDVDRLRRINRTIGRLFEETDPIPGRYTLEVSSPGLERPLRNAAHFAGVVGSEVKVKTTVEIDGRRRFLGVVESADSDGFQIICDATVSRIEYTDLSSARTTFAWGPTPKKGGKSKSKSSGSSHREATS